MIKEGEDDASFIVGDLNSYYYDKESKVRNLINFRNLKQLISQPTRIPSNTLLDPIISSSPLLVQTCGVLDPFCSDHKPVYVILKLKKKCGSNVTYKRKIWNYDRANYEIIRNTLQAFDWNSITDKNDIDECVDSFTKTLMSIAADHIPNYICTVRTMDKPWMANNIRNHIRKRKRDHKKAKQTNTEYNWTKFRKQRNYVIELIRKAKNDYFEKISIRINTDQNRSSK